MHDCKKKKTFQAYKSWKNTFKCNLNIIYFAKKSHFAKHAIFEKAMHLTTNFPAWMARGAQ